jgi:H/ACA ribonucleoprotein complex subunit 3
MPKLLRKCAVCGRYTLKRDVCPYCGGKLTMPYPPKFSPTDKYGDYRRKYKIEKAEELSDQRNVQAQDKEG